MMLDGRQSGETIFSTLPEPILNVDMLIVTFIFLPCLTAMKIPFYFTTDVFEKMLMIF